MEGHAVGRVEERAMRRPAKAKPIDYSTPANIERYVACKECVRYVLRTKAVHRWYCSDDCFRKNTNRRRGYEDRYSMGESL